MAEERAYSTREQALGGLENVRNMQGGIQLLMMEACYFEGPQSKELQRKLNHHLEEINNLLIEAEDGYSEAVSQRY